MNGIVCFSVRFCDNSLLALKIRFQVFSFASKNVQGFSSDMKILLSLLSVLFHLQSQFFEILIFSQDIWGNVYYVQPHFRRNSDKSLLSPDQNKLKEI